MSAKVQSLHTGRQPGRNNIHHTRMPQEVRSRSLAGRAAASFVLGIASIVLCVVPVMLVAAVVGLMLERESERLGEHPLQTPAKILCIIGIVLCSLAILAILITLFAAGILSRAV